MPETVSVPSAHRQLLAYVNLDPIACLASCVALAEQVAPNTLGVTILTTGRAHDRCTGVKSALESRGIEVAVYDVPFDDLVALSALLDELMPRLQQADKAGTPMLDVSGASAGQAVLLYKSADQRWSDGFSAFAYSPKRNAHRQLSPLGPGQQPTEWPVDIGELGDSDITPQDFLAFLGLKCEEWNPYYVEAAPAITWHDLIEPAKGMLTFYHDRYAADRAPILEFRERLQLAIKSRVPGQDIRLPHQRIHSDLKPVMEALCELGLAELLPDAKAPTTVSLEGDEFAGAPFFLGGGWLEVVTVEALRRALPQRDVVPNLRTTWGAGNRYRSTSAEIDVTYISHNRLHLVSCKNDAVVEHILRELDRFRAIVAEFGEQWVRPTLLSTLDLTGTMRHRLEAYEIGGIWSSVLVDVLYADLIEEETGKLLEAIEGVSPGGPMPGFLRRR